MPYIDLNWSWVYMCSPSWTAPATSLPTPSFWIIPVYFCCHHSMTPQTCFKHLLCVKLSTPAHAPLHSSWPNLLQANKEVYVVTLIWTAEQEQRLRKKALVSVCLGQTSVPLFAGCVILGKWLNCSVPLLWNGIKSRSLQIQCHSN